MRGSDGAPIRSDMIATTVVPRREPIEEHRGERIDPAFAFATASVGRQYAPMKSFLPICTPLWRSSA